jgi:gamma-glutamylcyclotransferase (GGCT)/AIG2-like uncharacterized protein YtfP
MNEEYLFVYGTLKRDSPMHYLLADSAEFVEEAIVLGHLYVVSYVVSDLSEHYPGLVLSTKTSDRVQGEVYRLREPGVILPRLDDYEGCDLAFPQTTEYVRRKEWIILKNDRSLEAWIYVYNQSIQGLPKIESGNFTASCKYV